MNSTEIDELVQRFGGRYRLTVMIQMRLKELVKGARKLVDLEDRNLINIVMEEIRQGKVTIEGQDLDEAEAAGKKKKKKKKKASKKKD